MQERVKIDFEQALGLDHKIGGYVARITSPKGMKKEEDGIISYRLHTESVGIPDSDGLLSVIPGLYEIIDICKWNRTQKLQWNIYLLVVEEDGNTYPVAEYLDSPHTLWVKKAVKVCRIFFSGENLPRVTLTPQPKKEPRKKESRPKEKEQESAPAADFMNPPEKPEDKPKKKKEAAPAKAPKKTKSPGKKKPRKAEECGPLKYGFARLMTFTGMVVGDYKILRYNKKYIEVETQKGVIRFSKETGKQVDAEKPKYANKIEWNLDKSTKEE